MTQRIGILTGGGDCPGLNAVIRAVVKVGVERHGWEVWGIEDAFLGIIDLERRSPSGTRRLFPVDVAGIQARGGTILGTTNRADPFHMVQGRGDARVTVDVSGRVLANAKSLGLDAVIMVGGDGTMRIARRFSDLGLGVVGVPKTIDNDIAATDVTFGFDTAVEVATGALDRIRDTAESHERVMVIELMGRDAGFIALSAGLAGGAHAILIPEIPYRAEAVARMVERRWASGRQYAIVVVAEGARPRGGEESVVEEIPGAMRRLGGAGARFAEELRAALSPGLDTDVRVTVLGHLQRGGSPSNFDRTLGTRFGCAAIDLVARGELGKMVALRGGEIVAVPLAAAASAPKRVDPNGELVSVARATGVVFGDEP